MNSHREGSSADSVASNPHSVTSPDLQSDTPTVLVNEVLAHTDLPQRDFIELYNASAGAANIGGWFITDKLSDPRRFRIPDNTEIPPHGYLVFDERHLGFAFHSEGDGAYIIGADADGNFTGYQHGFEFGATPNGWSLGRCEITVSQTLRQERFTLQSAITEADANALPQVGPVVISELLYAPSSGDEFIELRNVSSSSAPLYDPDATGNRWQIDGVGSYVFPPNTVIPPQGNLLVTSIDPDLFRSRYGVPESIQIVGPYTGKLRDKGERIALLRPDVPNRDGTVPYIEVDVVEYDSNSPWPGIGSTGKSLERIDATKFGDTHLNWQQSAAGGGTPGTAQTASSNNWQQAATKILPFSFVTSFLFLPVVASDGPTPQANQCM